MVYKHPLLETIVSYVYVCSLLSSTGAISGVSRCQKRVLDPLEPEL